MASCPVPDFPAVTAALEHLKELDKELTEDGVSFSPEASLHLAEITAGITELEASQRAAHEPLEVETIENSRLRQQISNMRERLSQEIMVDVAAARASHAAEIEQLHKDLMTVCQLREATAERREALLSQNEELYPEREQVRAEQEEIVAALNDRINFKSVARMQLDQTREQIEELKSCTAAAEQQKIRLEQSTVLERDAFAVKQDELSREVKPVEGNIKQQKQATRRSRRELERVNEKKGETSDRLGELTLHMAKLEGNLRKLTAARRQSEEQLEGETHKHQQLRQQRESLKKELWGLTGAFSVSIQCLKEEIATLEGKIQAGRGSRLRSQNSPAQIHETLKHQCSEENTVRAEHLHVSQQLERSKLQLEERIASIVKHSREIKQMDTQISELLKADAINKDEFERDLEELCSRMDTERRNIGQLKEEKRRLTGMLQEAKKKQEEHVAKVTSDISGTRRRHQELLQEEAALQQRQPKSVDADLLVRHIEQCKVEYRREETRRHQELKRCAAEVEVVTRSNEEKLRELEEKDEMLKEVEAAWSEEQARLERAKVLMTELRRRKKRDLELSIQGLKENTSSLLQPREELKAELEEARRRHMDLLDKQASELRDAETSIYDSGVKMEQVSVENSRLHLCIRRMTEGVSRAGEDRERYRQEARRLRQEARALLESLQEAWREEASVTEERQRGDGELLVSMRAMSDRLRTRRRQLRNISRVLQQQMSDWSRRLGDTTAAGQQSVSAHMNCACRNA